MEGCTMFDEVILGVLKLHAGKGLKDCPLSHCKPGDVWKWIDKMNEALKDTKFFYILTADAGVVVMKK